MAEAGPPAGAPSRRHLPAAADPPQRAPLVGALARWHGLVKAASPAGVEPLLRLEHGAGLLSPPREQRLEPVLTTLLPLAARRLAGVPSFLPPGATVRPKMRIALSLCGAGLLVGVHYHGEAPTAEQVLDVQRAVAGAGCVLGARTRGAAVELRAVLPEPARRMRVVNVLAGHRPVALPMACVRHARPVAAEAAPEAGADVPSLADCLGAEGEAAGAGRPALLMVAYGGAGEPLRVEGLVGHGIVTVRPLGPLFLAAPWLVGVVGDDGDEPVLVVDPVALLSARRAPR